MPRPALIALLIAGCATTSEQQRLAEQCEQSIEHDARCIDVLTSDAEGYESREQVMAAEEQRDAKEFEDRLARLRREEEERQATRARTSTASEVSEEDAAEELAEEVRDLAGAKMQGPGGLEVGSSIRALEAPTPEAYLRGARCVLEEDLTALRKTFEVDKRKRAQIGELAVVIVDSEALVGRIDEEMKHRRLPLRDGECKQHEQVVELLRSLVGRRIDARALARLTGELELRAGLPKAQ